MPEGVSAGSAYLRIHPQMAPGFSQEISRQMGRAADDATRTMSQRFRSFGSSLRSAGTQMSLGLTLPIVAGFKRVFDAASDQAEAINVTGLVFGDRKGEMGRWARNAARTVGLSETAARSASANVGGLLANLGFAQDETVTWSQKLVQLGADMGSAFNTDPADAVEAIGAALRGESDPIQRYNVMLNETVVNNKAVEMGLASSTGSVDENAKAQARLALIMEQTASIQGDFANTADGAANKQRILRAEFENSVATLGQQLLPIGAQLLRWVGGLINAFNGLNPTVQKFVLAGLAILAVIGPIVGVVGALATAFGFLGGIISTPVVLIAALAAAAVIAYRSVEPFREAIDGIVDAIARFAGNAFTQLRNLFDMFRSGDADAQGFAEILDNIFGNTGRLIPFFQRLWEIGVDVGSAFRDVIAPAFANVALAIGTGLVDSVSAVINWFNNLSDTGRMVLAGLAGLVGFIVAVSAVASVVGSIIAAVSAAAGVLSGIAATIGAAIALAFSPVVLVIVGIAALVAALVYAYNRSEWFRSGVQAAVGAVTEFFREKFEQIVAFVREIWPQISEAIGHALAVVRVVIGVGVAIIMGIWRLFGSQILDVIQIAWGVISGVISAALDVVMGIIRFALAVINGDWGAAWGALGDIVGGVWDAIYAVIGGALQVIGVIIGSALGAIRNTVVAIWQHGILPVFNTLAGVVSAVVVPVFNFLAAVVAGVWNGITTVIGFAWGIISAIFSAIVSVVTTVLTPVFNVIASVVSVVFTFIASVIEIHWGIIQAIFMAISWVVENALMPVFRVLGTVIGFVWQGISTVIEVAWSIIQVIWNAIVTVVNAVLIPVFNFLLAVAQLVWTGIQAAISFAWSIILGIWNAIKWTIDNVLMPVFNFLREGVVNAWSLITDGISFAWGVIRGVFDAVVGFVNETLIPIWNTVKEAVLDAFNGVKDTIGGIWDDITGGIRSGINAAIGFINTLIDGLNAVVNILPGVDLDFPNIPALREQGGPLAGTGGPNRTPRFATGGQMPVWDLGRQGSFVTAGARAIVGEGDSRYPEGVVATDPRFRRRNLGIMAWLADELGLQVAPKFADGGRIDSQDELDDARDQILSGGFGDPVGDVGGFIRRGAALAIFGPVNSLVKRLLNGIPWRFLRETAQGFRQKIYDWVRDRDEELPTAPPAGYEGYSGGGGVEQWRPVALEALRLAGSPASWIGSLLRRMNQESGGNQYAVNNWDSNAARGTPSKGLMQTIQPTFDAYAGHLRPRGIFDPLANIFASINYANARYGSAPVGWNRAGGYAFGGLLPFAGSFDLGGTVPGPLGAPALGLVHGQEDVLTPVQSSRLLEALRDVEFDRRPGAGLNVEGDLVVGERDGVADLDFWARHALAGAVQAGL